MISEITIKIAFDAEGNQLTASSKGRGEASIRVPLVPELGDEVCDEATPPVPEEGRTYIEDEFSSNDIPPPESDEAPHQALEAEFEVPVTGEFEDGEQHDIPPPAEASEESEIATGEDVEPASLEAGPDQEK